MVLSEAEAERRLSLLRRRRDTIDRAIADLALYLELGRRLGDEEDATAAFSGRAEASDAFGRGPARPVAAETERSGADAQFATPDDPGGSRPSHREGRGLDREADRRGDQAVSPPRPVARESGRSYGRALVQAAVSVLREARRPLHAGEILEALAERGFIVPGRQDPLAALNTRLWKRSGPNGLVRRLGDAVYALPDGPEAEAPPS